MPTPIETIIELCQSGRSVVPLLGAGISVESGIPTTPMIIDYLAKVECYFDYSVFHPNPEAQDSISVEYNKGLHLDLFGYPDPYQLNADIWQALSSDPGQFRVTEAVPSRNWMATLVQRKKDEQLEKNDRQGFALLTAFRAIAPLVASAPMEQYLQEIFADTTQRRRIVGICKDAEQLRIQPLSSIRDVVGPTELQVLPTVEAFTPIIPRLIVCHDGGECGDTQGL